MRMYVAGEWSNGAHQEELRSPHRIAALCDAAGGMTCSPRESARWRPIKPLVLFEHCCSTRLRNICGGHVSLTDAKLLDFDAEILSSTSS